MNPTDDAVAPKVQDKDITAPEGIDMDAINEAIADAEKNPEPQDTFAEDSATELPTNDVTAEPSAPAVAAAEPEERKAPTAGFVDGDIVDDPEAPAAPEETPDYAAREADPVDSFDENAPAPAAPAKEEDEDKPAEVTSENKAKKEKPAKKSIDFDAILHNNVAIAGIIAGAVVLLLVIVLIIAL